MGGGGVKHKSLYLVNHKVDNKCNECFFSNQRLSYAHRIMESPGGKHCKSLQINIWRGAVSPLKSSLFGQRMPHFAVIL